MSDYTQKTESAIEDARKWALESTERNLGTFVAAVDATMKGTYKADQMAQDTAKLMLGAQQDMARAFSTWSALMTGLVDE